MHRLSEVIQACLLVHFKVAVVALGLEIARCRVAVEVDGLQSFHIVNRLQ